MPTATDLVTDLPADFEVFGQAVATSMADLLGGPSGYILSKNSATDMDFVWIANDQGDITGITAGTGITVTSPTGPVPTVSINTAVTADLTTAQTLTNKTLTSPVLTTPSISNINAKGDILVGTSDNTLGIITAGSDGETLVSDSSTATGLRYREDYAAGKNAVINGAFNVWQRGTTFTGPAIFAYTADRWQTVCNGTVGGLVVSQQAFTAGTAPVAGYEGTYFLRQVLTSQSGGSVTALATRLEDVRLYANSTVTLSFWAKADASRTWSTRLIQSFGSGGSADVTTSGSSLSVTTAWTRFTQTFTVPSIAGKTIGAGSYLYVIIDGPINTAQTMDIWGVQVEDGSVATAFQTATGTIQGELSACQRYYLLLGTSIYSANVTSGSTYATNYFFPVQMRTSPTVTPSIVANSGFPATNPSAASISALGGYMTAVSNATTTAGYYSFTATASAEL